jgi:hypothetical protein
VETSKENQLVDNHKNLGSPILGEVVTSPIIGEPHGTDGPTDTVKTERANTKLRLSERIKELEIELEAQKVINKKISDQFNTEYKIVADELNFNRESLRRLLHI